MTLMHDILFFALLALAGLIIILRNKGKGPGSDT